MILSRVDFSRAVMANQPSDTALFGGEGYIIEGAEGGGMRLAVEGVDDELLEVGGAVLVDAEIHRNVAGFYQGDSPPRARRREILRI